MAMLGTPCRTSALTLICRVPQSSQYFTEDANEADAVFIDDYCYTLAWIAKEQSEEGYQDGFDPQAQLIEGYKRLLEHPRHVVLAAPGLLCLAIP